MKKIIVICSAVLLIGIAAAIGYWIKSNDTVNNNKKQPLEKVVSAAKIKDSYDVIVAGTDPEGVTSAISAARNGLSVLLVDGRNREILGGLMTLGKLNSLDPLYSPVKSSIPGKHNFLNKGLFQEWYDQIEGTSFDTSTAANVFYNMVKAEANIDLLMKTQSMEPIVEKGAEGNTIVKGLKIVLEDGSAREISAKAVIDATQDGDIAAAAGAPYTKGREDAGDPQAQMAVTLVFEMSGVTQEIWNSFAKHKNTGIDAMSAWGFPDAKDYVSSDPERVSLRGLNIGRQNDGTMLINAMHIYNVDPLDPASVAEAIEIGRAEAPRIVDFLTSTFEEFKDLKFSGTAEELYVRETRHFIGEYRLTIADLLDNRDHWDAIAYGSYDVDIQKTSPADNGMIVMSPYQFGVPFRTMVPKQVDGLLIAGKTASYDTLPHGSARVIPVGMATGQAAGVASRLIIDNGITFRELSQSKELIAELQAKLTEQGVDLTMNKFDPPAYTKHKAYKALIAAVSMGMSAGFANNEGFDLDGASNAQRYVYNLLRLKKMHGDSFKGDTSAAVAGMNDPAKTPLTLEQAIKTLAYTIDSELGKSMTAEEMVKRGWIMQATIDGIANTEALTNGEAFMLMRDVLEYYGNYVYE